MPADTKQRPVDDDAEGSVDDQFRGLLEGVRTSLPGVQVLFAFLLTASLQTSFADVSGASRTSFAIAFYASGAASLLLIAPSVHQRVRAPISGLRRQSETHLRIATWVTIVGTAAMGVAIAATVYLASSIVFGPTTASIATVALTAVCLWSWLYLPLVTFRRRNDGQ